jgi:hypothetical protein
MLANIIAGIIMTVIQITTLFIGESAGYYIFFSVIEFAATLFIAWTALKWKIEIVNSGEKL